MVALHVTNLTVLIYGSKIKFRDECKMVKWSMLLDITIPYAARYYIV